MASGIAEEVRRQLVDNFGTEAHHGPAAYMIRTSLDPALQIGRR